MQRIVSYIGEGRARRAVWSENEPAVGRVTGMIPGATARGFVVLGGEIVRGESERDHKNAQQREYKARRKARHGG
jgi:hypothetical protein